MTNDLIKKEDNKSVFKLPSVDNIPIRKLQEAAYLSVRGDIIDASDLAKFLNISFAEALSVISSANYSTFIHNLQMLSKKAEFDLAVIPNLMKMATGDGMRAVAAARELKELFGYGKKENKTETNININLEGIINKYNQEKNKTIDVGAVVFPGFE